MQQQQQQQPPQSQSPYRSGPPTNFLGYSQQPQQQQQQQNPRGTLDYASVTGHFTPQQQYPQRIPPPPSHHQQMQQQQQHQQMSSQQQGQQGGVQDPLSNLRMSLAQQKQFTEEQIKEQQLDQEAYASRFLAAVQERVSQPRPSSASAASQQQSHSNGVANSGGHGTSLQNLAATLQQEGLTGGYFDQDVNTYDFEAQHNANPPFQLSHDLLEKIGSLPNKMILYEVQIGLEQLLAEPSEFDAWIVAIRDCLARKDVTAEDLEAAAWLVIEMGICSENAQYNFAKVCTYLYERLSSFKESLLSQVKEFHTYRSQYSLETVLNILVFIAELYVQAFAPVGIRNHPIPTILYEEFVDILNAEPMTDSLVKKVVQTLKLCGRHLETDIGENSMGEIFKKLEDFTKEGHRPEGLTDTGASFITNLMLYRSSGWGGSTNDSTTTSATSAAIRFAPDNNMDLTEEEIRFLESNGAMEGGSSFSSGPSSNDIYDAEILEDYEKFLRDHAEQTAISAAEKALERLSMEEEDDGDSYVPHRDDNSTPTPPKS
uniref:MIF4G domain-containing protein n=1 Tax=Panagrolaimus sp. ES5 TaxID=591445 RepID=A0AC34FNZ7_9BILA